jgi:hypothetical protein
MMSPSARYTFLRRHAARSDLTLAVGVAFQSLHGPPWGRSPRARCCSILPGDAGFGGPLLGLTCIRGP